ncbi:hypothetical protein OG590_38360 (plasmid) [Streptomyces goshikiensis]|uniref:hypothetical protein n=1 Tax=Streptomyces TaxID=1883 RepID=UPI00069CD317|nr:hypothetical protein [Streptomyces sp. Mg1]WSY03049.1 hypothetical protein OG590_38360 [Streptomyces goshikiensis]
MTSPGTPTDQTVTISRDILTVLAMVDITQTARRVLDFLLAIHDDETGVGHISQDEMRRALGSSKPSQVNPRHHCRLRRHGRGRPGVRLG